jgi:hypothetical protein
MFGLASGRFARCHAQRARLLGRAIGRRRQVEPSASRSGCPPLLASKSGQIWRWWFLCHDRHDESSWHSSQLLYCICRD